MGQICPTRPEYRPSRKLIVCYGTSPIHFDGLPITVMVIFNSYVILPEGIYLHIFCALPHFVSFCSICVAQVHTGYLKMGWFHERKTLAGLAHINRGCLVLCPSKLILLPGLILQNQQMAFEDGIPLVLNFLRRFQFGCRVIAPNNVRHTWFLFVWPLMNRCCQVICHCLPRTFQARERLQKGDKVKAWFGKKYTEFPTARPLEFAEQLGTKPPQQSPKIDLSDDVPMTR